MTERKFVAFDTRGLGNRLYEFAQLIFSNKSAGISLDLDRKNLMYSIANYLWGLSILPFLPSSLTTSHFECNFFTSVASNRSNISCKYFEKVSQYGGFSYTLPM